MPGHLADRHLFVNAPHTEHAPAHHLLPLFHRYLRGLDIIGFGESYLVLGFRIAAVGLVIGTSHIEGPGGDTGKFHAKRI